MRSFSNFRAFALAAAVAAGAAWSGADTVGTGSPIHLFDGESTYGWTNFGGANWHVADGVLTANEGSGGWLATTCEFKDFELTVKIKVSRPGTTGIIVRAGLEGFPDFNGGTVVPLGGEEGDAVWQTVVVTALGDKVTATVDGVPVEIPAATRPQGYIGFGYHSYHRYNHSRRPETVEVSEATLRPLQLTPLFDGKTLDGWNVLPGHNSVFAVKDGAISITNGNGQIETAGTYKNFLLQLDCISNGEHLNSGVFFRGPVGEFWRGYESQVRNEWVGEDRTKPVDFGTGGLYGVQPARKVVSSDHEWFNKTIICDGNHFATWVNGYLVSDVTDTRPVSPENDGKNGFVPGPGTIHLQGHDPTTDLSFKNINISQY